MKIHSFNAYQEVELKTEKPYRIDFGLANGKGNITWGYKTEEELRGLLKRLKQLLTHENKEKELLCGFKT